MGHLRLLLKHTHSRFSKCLNPARTFTGVRKQHRALPPLHFIQTCELRKQHQGRNDDGAAQNSKQHSQQPIDCNAQPGVTQEIGQYGRDDPTNQNDSDNDERPRSPSSYGWMSQCATKEWFDQWSISPGEPQPSEPSQKCNRFAY